MSVCLCVSSVCLKCIYFGISHKLLKFLVMPFLIRKCKKGSVCAIEMVSSRQVCQSTIGLRFVLIFTYQDIYFVT